MHRLKFKSWLLGGLLFLATVLSLNTLWLPHGQAVTNESGSVGIEGTISAPPPKFGATITVPVTGQSFTTLPITVSGLCPSGLLVKLFKNNTFSGSTQCVNGSYSIVTDLYTGTNDLVARVYDDLDQPGPDSNVVTVTFNEPRVAAAGPRISLSSNYAKRGVNPGDTLTWPIILSGGEGPYAISVDWGDGTSADLISRAYPGAFDITHVYKAPGVYNIIVKATDKNGATAFLQLVGIGNGPLSQASNKSNTVIIKVKVLWWLAALMIPLVLSAFWLGKRHELYILRRRFERQDDNNH